MLLAIGELPLVLVAVGGTALGAFIGAATGGGVDFLLARSSEKREAKVGARLTRLNLSHAADHLKSAEGDGKWWVFFKTPMGGWHAHRAALAAQLTSDEFEVVTQSVAELELLGEAIQEAPIPPGSGYRVTRSSKELHKMREDATKAYNGLARLAEQLPVEGLLHDKEGAG